jgi:hypothetical protein
LASELALRAIKVADMFVTNHSQPNQSDPVD